MNYNSGYNRSINIENTHHQVKRRQKTKMDNGTKFNQSRKCWEWLAIAMFSINDFINETMDYGNDANVSKYIKQA